MAHLIKDHAFHRSYSVPLFIHEPNDDRTPIGAVTPPKPLSDITDDLDSTCITPISNACSTASQRSSLSITPTKSYTTTYLTPRSSLTSDTLSESTAAEFFSFVSESDDLNETVINPSNQVNFVYDTCIEASIRLAQATRSVRQRLRPFRRASTELLNRFPKLQRLSIVRAAQISIQAERDTKSEYCTCNDDLFDDNCLKTFMEMSVQPAEYRNNPQMMTSTPVMAKDVYDHSIFNVARIKKVELHDLSPKVPEFHVIDATPKDHCINNNNIRTPNGNHYVNPPNICVPSVTPATPIRTKSQHQSNPVTMPAPEDGNVLKKVISFTLDQINNADCATEKVARPSFVPEKLHFSAYEQFKGQLFVKWVTASIATTAELSHLDLNTVERLISEVCTHLIAAGVLKQIVDYENKTKNEFCPCEMYQWTHVELARQQINGPKKECVQVQCERDETNKSENDTMDTLTSNEQGESFASVKKDLLSQLVIDDSLSMNGENTAQHNKKSSKTEDQTKHDVHVQADLIYENSQSNSQIDCDIKLGKVFVENFTQTEIVDSHSDEQNPPKVPLSVIDSSSSSTIPQTIPPPPPPPPPFPTTANKENVPETSSTHLTALPPNNLNTNSAANVTVLSNASSFCLPPALPGIPGPPPLPLPPGNLWFKSDTLRKAAKHPSKPMINLFWTRILIPKEEDELPSREQESEQKEETESNTSLGKKREKLWQKIDETVLENADDFTELFARQATPKRPREVTKMPKKIVIKVLDHKRSQSVGIFSQSLYRHRIEPQVIQRAIYNWDLSSIGLDLLQQLLEHKASADELKAIKDALKNAPANVPLDGPENFLLKLSEISCAPERIACIIFRNDFEESNAQIGQKIKIIQNLCEFLMENDHLSDLFAIILTLGNFMNGGNRYRGQADGFGLDVLNKLKDVKSKDKKITLLHFIVKTFISKQRQNGLKPKEIIYPVPDAEDVKSASTVDFDTLNEQIEQLGKNLSDIKTKMEIVIDSSTEHNLQPFKDMSEEFVQTATNKIDYQFQQLRNCKIIFRETLEYFKHIPKSGTIDECTPSQFFELWSSFSADFRDLWKKELAAINAEIIQKYKSIASPKTPQNRTKGKLKPSGLRVRRVNQI